jgi:hypothetical protein
MGKHDDTHETKRTGTLEANDITTNRVGRRATIGIVGAFSAALAMIGLRAHAEAQDRRGCSDADPTDPAGAGRSCGGAGGAHPCSDVDPTDPGGGGRTCHTHGPCSDVDPTDPVAHGRWCPDGAPGSGGASRGCSDADPTDPMGMGRRC